VPHDIGPRAARGGFSGELFDLPLSAIRQGPAAVDLGTDSVTVMDQEQLRRICPFAGENLQPLSFGGIVLFGGIVVVRVGERKPPMGGWLFVLCVLLLVWQPISFGLAASTMLDRLAARGLPLALILLTRVVVVGFGIAAGLALIARRPGAVNLAKVSLILTAALDVFVYATPYFPTNLPPGDASLYAGASILYCVVWLAYLARSKRVRELDRG